MKVQKYPKKPVVVLLFNCYKHFIDFKYLCFPSGVETAGNSGGLWYISVTS